ncbi:MAG: hypothetical protein H6Q74_2545 [Firmicutes bacterium]|nr:hypothetical protein [Bacillota bacterium]
MSREERRERNKEAMRKLILDAATEIMGEDGIKKFSIRKLADRIEYSPAIIYHYFKNKETLLDHILTSGYQKIIAAITSANSPTQSPVERLKKMTSEYILTASSMQQEYMTAELSSSPDILKFTAVLSKGASTTKPALGVLCQCLRDIHHNSPLPESEIELRAQMIVIAVFGLIMKVHIEIYLLNNEDVNRLFRHFIDVTVLEIAGVRIIYQEALNEAVF